MTKDITPLLAQMGLSADGLKKLPQLRAIVVEHVDAVLSNFYGQIQSDPGMSGFFASGDRMNVAKSLQKRHWLSLFDGTFSQDYIASTRRVGHKHFEIQLPFAMYLSGYVRVLGDLQERIIRSRGMMMSGTRRQECADLITLLSRLFFLDVTLVIDAYFEAQSAELQAVFRHIGTGVERVANKDLSALIPTGKDSGYPERYGETRDNFNRAMSDLSAALNAVRGSADEVDVLVRELASATESLSGRTENQAAALEQTSAALAEINQKVRAAAASADEAEAAILKASEQAEAGGQVVLRAVDAMSRIETSSSEIANIISVIDEIAFQTNLLALNAGVEAARAGDSGRGFAVVASEVRSLAMRSSDAAKHIRELISDSNKHVKNGVGLVRAAGDTLQAIVEHVDTAAGLSTSIARLSKEQSSTVQEITAAIGQIDEMTQQNAAMAEESAASGQMLRQEAGNLHELLGGFALAVTENSDRRPEAAKTRSPRSLPGADAHHGHVAGDRGAKVRQLRQLQQARTKPAPESGWEDF